MGYPILLRWVKAREVGFGNMIPSEFRKSGKTGEFDTCPTGFYDARNEVGRG